MTNPESGRIDYRYNPAGSVREKKFLQDTGVQVIVTMEYDRLERITSKSYAGAAGTPNVVYCYDGRTTTGSGCSGTRRRRTGRGG